MHLGGIERLCRKGAGGKFTEGPRRAARRSVEAGRHTAGRNRGMRQPAGAYSARPSMSCLRSLRQEAESAAALARLSAGSSIAAKMAMKAITTGSSMSVKARCAAPFGEVGPRWRLIHGSSQAPHSPDLPPRSAPTATGPDLPLCWQTWRIRWAPCSRSGLRRRPSRPRGRQLCSG